MTAWDREPQATEDTAEIRAYDKDALLAILRDGKALTRDRLMAMEIGDSLNNLGGFEMMVSVAMEIRAEFPDGEGGVDGWHPQEIDFIWNNIGGWRA